MLRFGRPASLIQSAFGKSVPHLEISAGVPRPLRVHSRQPCVLSGILSLVQRGTSPLRLGLAHAGYGSLRTDRSHPRTALSVFRDVVGSFVWPIGMPELTVFASTPSYDKNLRLTVPPNTSRPVPNRMRVPGSGTRDGCGTEVSNVKSVEVLEIDAESPLYAFR
jgi:hypothetical protein